MAWINGLERKRFNEEQKRLAEQYRAAGMTEEQIEQMYQFDLVEFNSRRRFSEHTQQFSENAFEESDDDKSPLLEKYLAHLSTSLDFTLYVFDDLTQNEIGVRFGISQKAVSKRIEQIRKHLNKFS